ncbi:engulfment of apoptotic cell [Branchiostoma belcheri]|nr:engulfment of apoptotic cell [Branchiostoma belcheri]
MLPLPTLCPCLVPLPGAVMPAVTILHPGGITVFLAPLSVLSTTVDLRCREGKSCWITLDSQLPLALAAPACAVVAANLVILLLVVKAMLNSMAKKVDKDRTRTALWSSCVILPLLGATVVLAVFAVNRSAVLFQYLFAMCNTLLGLFMLLFYCVGNKQVLDIVKSRMCAAEETDPPSDPDVAISAQNPTAVNHSTYSSNEDKLLETNF